MVICHHFDRVKMAKLSVASIDLEGNLRFWMKVKLQNRSYLK